MVGRRVGMRRPIFWTQNPEAGHWPAHLDAALTVYDATDDWSLMHRGVGNLTCSPEKTQMLEYIAHHQYHTDMSTLLLVALHEALQKGFAMDIYHLICLWIHERVCSR